MDKVGKVKRETILVEDSDDDQRSAPRHCQRSSIARGGSPALANTTQARMINSAAKVGNFYTKLGSKTPPSSPFSPSKVKRQREEDLAESPSSSCSTPSSSKKRGGGGKGQKWHRWEEDIIREEVVKLAERSISWHQILEKINERRDADEPRTLKSIRMHWSSSLRHKMLQP